MAVREILTVDHSVHNSQFDSCCHWLLNIYFFMFRLFFVPDSKLR